MSEVYEDPTVTLICLNSGEHIVSEVIEQDDSLVLINPLTINYMQAENGQPRPVPGYLIYPFIDKSQTYIVPKTNILFAKEAETQLVKLYDEWMADIDEWERGMNILRTALEPMQGVPFVSVAKH